jgi:hypothetical protein
MRTLTEKYLGGLELQEDIYKVDLAALDRYQSFSGELLRLALLGIAGYGFLITNVVFKDTSPASLSKLNKVFLIGGALILGVSAASALGHRYFSTDCITHYVRRLRLEKQIGNLPEGDPVRDKYRDIVKVEEKSLEKDVNWCRWLLLISSFSLVIGAFCVAAAFAAILL